MGGCCVWNIVISFFEISVYVFGDDGMLLYDECYVKVDEFMDVVYK